MTGFRGSDDALDREIEALERIAKVRIRRVSADLHEIDRALRDLRREKARRHASLVTEADAPTEVEATTASNGSD